MTDEPTNPWTPEDEREHFPSTMEWWCAEAFFTSLENAKQWSLKATLTEWFSREKTTGSILNISLFDHKLNDHTVYYARNGSEKIQSSPDRFDIRSGNSYMKGSYPDYIMHFHDLTNDIELHLQYHAISLPHWVAQNVTNGLLPMGLGFYRYGFIPKCSLSGTMKRHDTIFTLKGIGYFEHVWGNFSYHNPLLSTVAELKKTLSTYAKLIGWWMHTHDIRFPTTIAFSTENNPFGYDWTWAVLDNGWTIFYGNILFWVMKGPIAGSLILTKDGKTYKEFSNVSFQYTKTRYAKNYDFYYPSELEVTAVSGKETLHLRFTMTTDTREYVSRFSGGKYWLALVICEASGIVEGYYTDGEQKIQLSGICRIEPQRQISVIGHNVVTFNLLLPPKGIGISMHLESHFLRKNLFINLQLAPRPKLNISCIKIDASTIHKNIV